MKKKKSSSVEELNKLIDKINYIDSLDGVLFNEPHLQQVRKLLEEAIEENKQQYSFDSKEQEILDKVHKFPEELVNTKTPA